MKAAVVYDYGKSPAYRDFADPIPEGKEVAIDVIASALTNFTKLRAAGKHYSTSTVPPFVPGIDGVGRLEDGSRVYFLFPRAPFGGMAQRAVAQRSTLVPLPDGIDDVTVAAIADPGMSAWAALRERAGLRAGETVLVNGATGTAGGLALQIAKYLGAGTTIATGRNSDALRSLRSTGADRVVDLTDEARMQSDLHDAFTEGVDIVIDYLWGASAEKILAAAATSGNRHPTRFVQVGTASAPTITLAGAPLHSSPIEIKGSGVGSVHPAAIARILRDLLEAAPEAGFHVPTRIIPLADVENAWTIRAASPRIVFTVL
jgi:NADPH:quinone reductase-like Zn-dependent oxidoreductase